MRDTDSDNIKSRRLSQTYQQTSESASKILQTYNENARHKINQDNSDVQTEAKDNNTIDGTKSDLINGKS